VNLSNVHFDPALPYWQDFLPFLNTLSGQDFPRCRQLNALLPDGLCSLGGRHIQFTDSRQLDDDGYEHRIYTTGQVSTRPNNWHDLFNALIWMRFPHIKTAMNSMHYEAGAELRSGSRGPVRDALTLFDECGVIVFSNKRELLEALAQRRWSEAFLDDSLHLSAGIAVVGHAILEKYLAPYKAMTAKALLIHTSEDFMLKPRSEQLNTIDRDVAKSILDQQLLNQPASLSPLPLAGVRGWWPEAEQESDGFYDDLQVFRPAPVNLMPVPELEI
jgi:hypothetical protein